MRGRTVGRHVTTSGGRDRRTVRHSRSGSRSLTSWTVFAAPTVALTVSAVVLSSVVTLPEPGARQQAVAFAAPAPARVSPASSVRRVPPSSQGLRHLTPGGDRRKPADPVRRAPALRPASAVASSAPRTLARERSRPGAVAEPQTRLASAVRTATRAGTAVLNGLGPVSAAVVPTAGSLGFTSLAVSPDLNCNPVVSSYTGHPSQVYGDTACATFLIVNGTTYGPAVIPAGPTVTAWTPISQATSGTGTSADPFVTRTVVGAGSTGVTLTQQDTWVPGRSAWTTDVTIANPLAASVTRVTHARDCFVAESDIGTGLADASTGITWCQGRSAALALVPGVSGASFVESQFSTVWALATADADLPGTYVPDVVDNGQAVSWALDPALASQSRSWGSALFSGPTAQQAGTSPNPSTPPTTCNTSRPVNCATGDFWHQFTDVAVPARGLPLAVARTYDVALSGVQGRFGFGWHDALDMAVSRSGDIATVTQENGGTVQFALQPDGSWAAPFQVLADLAQTATGWEFSRRESRLTYAFDASGRLMSVRTPSGEAIQLQYGASGTLDSVSQSGAGRITFGWTGGRITAVTDPMNRTTTYTYSAAGDLVAVAAPGSLPWRFTYDAAHRMLSMTSPRGGTTTNTYDVGARVVAQKLPTGGTITFDYLGDPATPAGSTTTMTDEHGVQTVTQYSNMLMTSRTVQSGTFSHTTSFVYDLVTHRLVQVTEDGPSGPVVRTSNWDILGRLVETVDPQGASTVHAYDGTSFRRTSTTSPLGVADHVTYDVKGRVTTSTSPDGVTTTFTYGNAAHPDDVTTAVAAGRTVSTAYDALGVVTASSVTDGSSTVQLVHQSTDASGAVYCAVSPTQWDKGVRCGAAGTVAPGTSATTFDAAGRPSTVTSPTGGVVRYTYDAAGGVATVADETNRVTSFTYDLQDRVRTTTRASGTPFASVITTTYDVVPGTSGCPVDAETVWCTRTVQGTKTTVDGFNADAAPTSHVLPGGAERHVFHVGGLVSRVVRENGVSADYVYDRDLLTGVIYSDSTPNVSLGYDADRRRASMSDGSGSSTFEYDTAGRLAAVTTPNGTVRAGYAPDGLLSTVTYPDGQVVTREHDVAGRLSTLTDWAARRFTFAHDGDGSVTSATVPGGRAVTSTYDARGNLLTRTVPGTGISLSVVRDASGRTSSSAQAGLPGPTASAVTYDAIGRLSAVAGIANTSDALGNPTAVDGATQTFGAGLAVTGQTRTGVASRTFTTAVTGERTSETVADGGSTEYRYDAESRLTDVWSFTGAAVSALSASSGTSAGGGTVTVTGRGFLPGARVLFGSRAAATTYVSPTTLTAVVPAGSGAVDVTVSTLLGRSVAVPAGRYTYQGPTLTAISPKTGTAAGGTVVTITGWNFTGATKVAFGAKAATFTVTSAEKIVATAPSGTGTVPVVVTTPQGSSSATAASFAYVAPPIITSVSPVAGKSAGGTTVTIKGSNFTGVTGVKFGTKSATGVQVSSATTLTAVAPSGTGVVHVTATSPKGTSATSDADLYGYSGGPIVLSVSPTSVPAAGGTTVTVTGSGFTSTSKATVGGKAATLTFVSSTSVKVSTPAGTGSAHVVVTNGTTSSPSIPKDRVTYLAPAVKSMSFVTGPAAGGQVMTITGTRLAGATAVRFGSVAGTALTLVSATSLRVTAPPGTGTVDVRVVTPEGTSPVVAAGRYTYTTDPIVRGVSMVRLRAQGGESLAVDGWNLAGLTSVTFGATSVPVESSTDTTATVTTPAGDGVVTVSADALGVPATSPRPVQAVYSERDDRYTYDGDGQRVLTTSKGGSSTPYVWDPFADAPALLVAGTTLLMNGPGDVPVEQVSAGGTALSYVHDERGSTRALLAADGTVAASFAYTAYGAVSARTGSATPVIGFAAGIQDPTGLVLMRHRYLDPTTGSFLTVDPAMQLTGQPYAYADGDPVNAVDRDGLWPIPVITAAIGGVVGAVSGGVGYVLETAATGEKWDFGKFGAAVAGGTVGGVVTGFCAGFTPGTLITGGLGASACGAIGNTIGGAVKNRLGGEDITLGTVGKDFVIGGVAGGLGQALTRGAGIEVTRQTYRSIVGRYGGLKASNIWRPSSTAAKYYGGAVIGEGIQRDLDLLWLGAETMYDALYCP